MSEDTDNIDNQTKDSPRSRKSGVRYPKIDLRSSVEIATQIENDSAGKATIDLIANLLNQSPTSSSITGKIAAMGQFGLIDKEGELFVITDLAKKIIYKIDDEQHEKNLKQAFFSSQIYSDAYKRLKGKFVPKNEILRNILIQEFKISSATAENAVKTLLDSATYANIMIEKDGSLFCLDLEESLPEPINRKPEPIEEEDEDEDSETETSIQESESEPVPETSAKTTLEQQESDNIEIEVNDRDLQEKKILNVPISKLSNQLLPGGLSISIILNLSLDLNIPTKDLKERLDLVKEFTKSFQSKRN